MNIARGRNVKCTFYTTTDRQNYSFHNIIWYSVLCVRRENLLKTVYTVIGVPTDVVRLIRVNNRRVKYDIK